MHVEEELYCPCSENKGADQLCSYLVSHGAAQFVAGEVFVSRFDSYEGEEGFFCVRFQDRSC